MTNQVKEFAGSSFSEQMREFLRAHLSWFLAVALGLLLLQDVFGAHGLIAMRRSMREAAQVQREIDLMNEENRRLEEDVKSLKTDPSSVERIAREEMGLARPGEFIFKIQPKSGDAAAPPSPAEQSASPAPTQGAQATTQGQQ
jgi:cell division protein FtsB